ncbi:uncharacterized protein LOC144159539 [Haemaphysalis longicornis]
MGCANAKAAGVPVTGNGDLPLEVTDGSDRANYPLPKVVINGSDFLDNDHHVKATDAEDKVNGNIDPPESETFLPPPEAPQEAEFLAPPEPPQDDDKVAVADRVGETPIDDGNDVIDDIINSVIDDNQGTADDNGNQVPPSDATTQDQNEDEPMPEAGEGSIADHAAGNDAEVKVEDNADDDIRPEGDVVTDLETGVIADADDRISAGDGSDHTKDMNDAPRDIIGDNDTLPNDIFVDDGFDYNKKKVDRNNDVNELFVQDA